MHNKARVNLGVYMIAPFAWAAIEFVTNGLDNWPTLLLLSALAIFASGYLGSALASMTRVDIDNDRITLEKERMSVSWRSIESIKFVRFLGLYKLEIEEGTFYFAPAGQWTIFDGFGEDDPFEDLIDRKKRFYNL